MPGYPDKNTVYRPSLGAAGSLGIAFTRGAGRTPRELARDGWRLLDIETGRDITDAVLAGSEADTPISHNKFRINKYVEVER